MTTQAEMLALTAGDLQGVGSAVVAGNREGAIQVPENVCPQTVGGLLQERQAAFDARRR